MEGTLCRNACKDNRNSRSKTENIMKELVILSGKGGTGKTSITAAFSHLAHNHVVCDADVDAADLHLLIKPEIQETHNFMGGGLAQIRNDDCCECGKCIELCRFNAITDNFKVNPLHCEGCGVCVDLCPEKAIDFPIQKCGEWFISSSSYGPMVHARLGIAEENSGKLVSVIRAQAKELAEKENKDLVLIDGPPGIGCPVIASITGATALVIIVEPTLSGLHDMKRVAQLATHFRLPVMVCINKYDINLEVTKTIEQEVKDHGLELVGHIPFNPVFVHSMVNGQNVFAYNKEPELLNNIQNIWQKIVTSKHMKGDESLSIPVIS